ncbi:MAG: hypothetical protein GY928_16705 [Colwellia sp.]|nr:hypothetical protein [Colwellia sp.]
MAATMDGYTIKNTVLWRENVQSRTSAFASLQEYKNKLMGIKSQMTSLGDIKIKVEGLKEASKDIERLKQQAVKPTQPTDLPRTQRPPTQPREPRKPPRTPEEQAQIEATKRLQKVREFMLNGVMRKITDEKRKQHRMDLLAIKSNDKLKLRMKEILGDEREHLRLLKQKNFAHRRSVASIEQMAGGMFSVYTAMQGIASTAQVGMDFQKIDSSMVAVSKDSKEAGDNIAYIRGESRRLGSDLVQASKGFTQMLAAGQGKMKLDDMKELTTGVMEASTVLGLSADDTAGSIRALVQVISKGTVMSEEIKGQLG